MVGLRDDRSQTFQGANNGTYAGAISGNYGIAKHSNLITVDESSFFNIFVSLIFILDYSDRGDMFEQSRAFA